MEGKRSRWGGWPSKPERAVSRFLVGSTPTLFRQLEDGLTARLQDISPGPELGILSDRCGDPAVASGIAARTEQQDEKDKSRSHAEPRLKRGRKAKSRLNCHFEANFNTCS